MVVTVVISDGRLREEGGGGGMECEDISALAGCQNDGTPCRDSEDRRDLQVPVVEVVRECLVVPLDATRRLAQLHHAVGVQLAARSRLGLLLRQVWIAGAGVERAVRPDQKGIPRAAGGGFELPACLVRHGFKTPFRSPCARVERGYEAAAPGECRCDEDSLVSHLR